MNIIDKWYDYEILDMASGEKIERWGDYILRRPDPQVIWSDKNNKEVWNKVNAIYHRSTKGGGTWENITNMPSSWQIKYNNLTFNLKQMGFKHTGLFPEQAYNWDYMIDKIKSSNREIKVLNLFAYTGGATCACLLAGASVCHVDSSRGMIEWAKENVKSSSLDESKVRYIEDDVFKFVEREIRRENKYDAIIMDPPSFGRGSNKEVWDIEKDLYKLVKLCGELLSTEPLFFLINSYTTGLSPKVLENILNLTINNKYKGLVISGELGLPMNNSGLILPCGIYGRWEI